jgi:hypothetical protein
LLSAMPPSTSLVPFYLGVLLVTCAAGGAYTQDSGTACGAHRVARDHGVDRRALSTLIFADPSAQGRQRPLVRYPDNRTFTFPGLPERQVLLALWRDFTRHYIATCEVLLKMWCGARQVTPNSRWRGL